MVRKLEVGDILGGRYRVDAFIGEGGMGVVARATQLDLGRTVAVKALRPEVRGNEQVVERFYREARAASRIQGPHAVQILDVGRTEDGTPYLVMELLAGEDLDHLVRRKGKLRLDVATWLMVQACSGVADAHRMRVVHRDLKPSNLFLAQRAGGPVLKVLDFGISRLDEQATDLTRTMTQLGTPHYMSPEQIERPKSVDHRTDIWALGCIFHKLLTGQTAFRGQGAHLVSEVLRGRRVKPSTLVPDVPAEVDAIVDRCLAQTPDARYQSADELAAALRAIAPGDGADSEPVTTPIPADEPEADTTLDVAVQVEHTLALEQSQSSSQAAPPSFLVGRTQAMDAPRTSRAHWSLPVSTRARAATSSWGLPAAAFAAIAVVCTGVFVAPQLIGAQLAAKAARAGLTLRYADTHTTLSGLTLDDLEVSATATPGVRIRATKATFSYSMESLTLEGADADLGEASDLTSVLVSSLGGGRFALDAENAHFTVTAGGVRVEGNQASIFLDVADATSQRSSADRFHLKISSPDLHATGLGLDLPRMSGRLDGTPHEGTFTATSSGPIAVQGSFDAAGFVASARVPRQCVSPALLSEKGFSFDGASSEVSRSLDAVTASGTRAGTIYLSVVSAH